MDNIGPIGIVMAQDKNTRAIIFLLAKGVLLAKATPIMAPIRV